MGVPAKCRTTAYVLAQAYGPSVARDSDTQGHGVMVVEMGWGAPGCLQSAKVSFYPLLAVIVDSRPAQRTCSWI